MEIWQPSHLTKRFYHNERRPTPRQLLLKCPKVCLRCCLQAQCRRLAGLSKNLERRRRTHRSCRRCGSSRSCGISGKENRSWKWGASERLFPNDPSITAFSKSLETKAATPIRHDGLVALTWRSRPRPAVNDRGYRVYYLLATVRGARLFSSSCALTL